MVGIWARLMLLRIRKNISDDAAPYHPPTERIRINTAIPWDLHGRSSIPILWSSLFSPTGCISILNGATDFAPSGRMDVNL